MFYICLHNRSPLGLSREKGRVGRVGKGLLRMGTDM